MRVVVMTTVVKRTSMHAGITYTVSLEEQQVVVKGGVPYDEVLGKIQKTGKEVGCGRQWCPVFC